MGVSVPGGIRLDIKHKTHLWRTQEIRQEEVEVKIKLTNQERQRLLTIAEDLIRLESDSLYGSEKAVSDYIFQFFQKLQTEVQKQECTPGRDNIIARIKGTDSSHCTMYSGHMDTVPLGNLSRWTSHPLRPAVRNGNLYGRGSCDMKGSIACTLFAAEYMRRHGLVPNHDILFVYDVDEENQNLGLKKYLGSPAPADLILVGEPTNLRLNAGHRGVMAFTVTIHGKSAHAGQAALGKNAIYAAAQVIASVKALEKELSKISQKYVGAPSITVTQISGGEKVNVVPDRARLRIDRRLIFGENCFSCTKQLEEILKDIEKETGCAAELEVTTYCPPGKIDPDTFLFRQLAFLLEEAGMNSHPEGFPASCEAGLLQEKCRIPAVIFGPGSISQAHQIDEYISLDQLYKGAELYIQLFTMLNYTENF